MLVTDFKKVHRNLYTATGTPAFVDVPELDFLAVDGTGDPSGPRFADAVQALYGVSYAIRFALKRAGVVTYPVMPLQGLWSGAEHRDAADTDRDTWRWTIMIMQPPQATPELVAEQIAATAAKRPSPTLRALRPWRLAEGTCAQVLHVGPYRQEPVTLGKLYALLDERGYRITGRHHEIYLSDPRRVAEDKRRTILRYPVSPTTR